MNYRLKSVMIASVIVLFLAGCAKRDELPGLNGPYFGQERPGDEPQLFMPGLVSTNYLDRCVGFFDNGKVCIYQNYSEGRTRTYYTYIKEGRWTESQRVPFENEKGGTDFTTAPDNRTLVFQSSRPTSTEDSRRETNTWAVEWTGSGWTEPHPLPSPANTDQYYESYPSIVLPVGSPFQQDLLLF